MTFADAIENMTATNNGAKRNSMTGYIWKFTTAKNEQPAITTDGQYYLSFVQRDGDQFLYKFASNAFTYLGKVAAGLNNALDNVTGPTVGNTLELDALLLTHIKGNDWSTGKQSDLENVRVPDSGTQW